MGISHPTTEVGDSVHQLVSILSLISESSILCYRVRSSILKENISENGSPS